MTVYSGGKSEPHFLIVPGLNDSGPTHWQSRWLDLLRNSSKADLGDWSNPTREGWTARLNAEIQKIDAPIILVAHSLGCHTVAHWAANAGEGALSKVFAALLVAPPDCERDNACAQVRQFGPGATAALPFPAILTASENDNYATLDHARQLARAWRADFINAGRLGHINAASDLGIWTSGLAMLGRLIAIAGFGRKARLTLPAAAIRKAPAQTLRAAA